MADHCGNEFGFPPVDQANEWGLLAIGGDLSPERLLRAYRSGIFPWGGEPLRWYAPDPRCVMEIPDHRERLPRRLRRTVRQRRRGRRPFAVRCDTAFEQVIRACAEPAPDRDQTWLSPRMIRAYCTMHRLGYAHSVECWVGEALVGGLYGVTIGGLFSGESMFHHERDASKVAFAALLERLERAGFRLLDCQMPTEHLLSLGASIVSRQAYMEQLAAALRAACTF